MSSRVIVVGAGVIGLCAARELALRGARVTVLDRAAPAGGCSFGNSGLLSPGHAPLPAPGVAERLTSARGQPGASARVSATPDPALDRWMDLFAAACDPEHYAAGLSALCALTPLINPLYDELASELPPVYDHRQHGALLVATAPATLDGLRAYASAVASRGCDARVVDAAEARAIEPSITGDILGGAHFPDWSTLDPLPFTRAVGERARELGAEIRTDAAVAEVRGSGVTLGTGETLVADAVVLATGADAEDLLAPLGVHLPMASALGWHADINPGPALGPGVIVSDRDVILTPMNGRVRLSGLVEITRAAPTAVDPARVDQLRAGPDGVIGGTPGELVSTWVGRRPCLPDGLPAIGPVPGTPGLFVASGHARMGLTLGPATGRLIAQMIFSETLSAPAGAFAPARFAPAAV